MMNYVVLSPLVVGVLLAFLRASTSKVEVNSAGNTSTYKYDPVTIGVILVMVIILSSTSLWLPYVQPGKDNSVVYLGCTFISIVGVIGCLWLNVFRVRVTDDFIEYGAFIKKKIYFSDIKRVRIARKNIKGMVVVYPSNGFKVVFSYTLSGFSKLRLDIEKRIPSSIKIEYW